MTAKRAGCMTVAMCLAVGYGAYPAHGQAPLKVGDHFEAVIDSSQPSTSDVEGFDTGNGTLFEIHHPGATYIAIHFEKFDLAPGDYVVVSDAFGGQRYTLEGKGKMNAGTFWSQHVKGDTAVVELVSRGQKRGKGFVIDEYVAGFADLGVDSQFEAICGSDDKLNAVCYASSHPTEYDRGRAVARLLISGSSLCTGWLASASNHLVTNEHCISTSSAATNTDYEFGAEAPNCSDSNCQLCHPGEVFSGATFIQDNAALDYALVQIESGNPAGTYGFLQIDNREAVVGEEIYIPQHAGGDAKEFGIESSDSDDANGLCHVNTFSSGCSSSSYNDVGYQCDTEGGSSGSPVLARSSHKVIALHHCANCPNRGVPINLVCAEICGFLGPECSVNADCDDADPCTTDTCTDGACSNDPVQCPTGEICVNGVCEPDPCDGDGVCESGEDCNNCSSDCFAGSGAECGNGLCEAGNGEDCVNCPSDCNGVTSGPPFDRFCCGATEGCDNTNCNSGGFSCTTSPSQGSCCGDGVCEGDEDSSNCAVDCGGSGCSTDGDCDDGDACTTDVCSSGVCSNSQIDCDDGDACTADSCSGGSCFNDPISCDDGDACTIDSCDSATGCMNADPSCGLSDGCCPSGCSSLTDPDCTSCGSHGTACSSDADCCSSNCRSGTCRGN